MVQRRKSFERAGTTTEATDSEPEPRSKPRPKARALGELSLIETIRKRASRIERNSKGKSQIQLGIGDDCALLRPRRGHEFAVTTDLSIEGRHFRLDWHAPESVGHRALARGLSDLAAMGAKPVAAFLSLALPRPLTVPDGEAQSWVERFLDGLLALAAEYRVPLAGGDLAESPLALADIVLTGSVPKGRALLRSGARPGDLLYVTGSLGGSAAQLAALSASPKDFAKMTAATGRAVGNTPHLYPQPRIAHGLWLRKHRAASAAIDLSDGLSTDLAHLCKASGVAAEITASQLPLGIGATLEMALHGGEDYELLFTAPASTSLPAKIAGVPITQIGRIVALKRKQPQVAIISKDGPAPLHPQGWEHFSG